MTQLLIRLMRHGKETVGMIKSETPGWLAIGFGTSHLIIASVVFTDR